MHTQMGVAETHQVLTRNELRERVTLRADGGFRSGRDVLVAAALGADEYGFGTVAMIATGRWVEVEGVCGPGCCTVWVPSLRVLCEPDAQRRVLCVAALHAGV
jgi:glutamate synthase domain-containing protein 2